MGVIRKAIIGVIQVIRLPDGRRKTVTRLVSEEEHSELEARYARTHPEPHRGISGCCDPPEG